MSTEMKRRIFLKRSLAASAVGIAAGAGLLAPQQILAAWNKSAFEAKKVPDALNALFGTSSYEESDQIKFETLPSIAESPAAVPVAISTTLENVESISILAPSNPVTLIANFVMGKNSVPYANTRIKLARGEGEDDTVNVIAIVKSNGKLYGATGKTKVTIGGCGG